ncbi:MAG: hypothetical protein ACOYXB_06340 [Bacteroidota bacterium]
MKRTVTGILLGALAGVIDVIPMIVMKLSWDANISAFSMWVVIGFLLSVTDMKIHPVLKGIVLAFMVLLPSAILIGWKEPSSLIPVAVMTTILGGLLGFTVHKACTRNQ